MSAFAFKIFDTQAIIANIYLVFLCARHCSERFAFNLLHPHSHPTRQALLLTHFINGAMEISNLPRSTTGQLECQHSITTTLPPIPAQTRGSAVRVSTVQPPFCSLKVGFFLLICIQINSFPFPDRLNGQYSYVPRQFLTCQFCITHSKERLWKAKHLTTLFSRGAFRLWNNLGFC